MCMCEGMEDSLKEEDEKKEKKSVSPYYREDDTWMEERKYMQI